MTLWQMNLDLHLTAGGLEAATVVKSLRPEIEAKDGLGLAYRGAWDTSG